MLALPLWPSTGTGDVNVINTSLSLNIIENGLTYTCSADGANPGTAFECFATTTDDTRLQLLLLKRC